MIKYDVQLFRSYNTIKIKSIVQVDSDQLSDLLWRLQGVCRRTGCHSGKEYHDHNGDFNDYDDHGDSNHGDEEKRGEMIKV